MMSESPGFYVLVAGVAVSGRVWALSFPRSQWRKLGLKNIYAIYNPCIGLSTRDLLNLIDNYSQGSAMRTTLMAIEAKNKLGTNGREPTYQAARAVAATVETHFAHHLAQARARGEQELAPEPSARTIERIIDATFWAS